MDWTEVALYKYQSLFAHFDNAEFDKLYEPGMFSAWSGIYRCEGCGREAVHTIGRPLPPQNHHQHTVAQGRIRWRLVVTDNSN
jgi:hypothetical protein